MPRPRSLSPDRLAGAALAVLDRDGALSLSMRAVAAELHMSTMGLYRYVADRDELECLVVDHLLRDLDLDLPVKGPWREDLAELARRGCAAVLRHPAAIPLVVSHRQVSPHALRWSEAMLAVLAEAGLEGADRVIAFRALLAYIFGALQLQTYGPLTGAGTRALAELPADRFPHLADTAMVAGGLDPEQEFRAGIELLLRGLRPVRDR